MSHLLQLLYKSFFKYEEKKPAETSKEPETEFTLESAQYVFITTAVLWGCRIYNQVKDFIIANESLTALIQELSYFIEQIYSFLTLRRMEPRESQWISVSYLLPNTTSITQTYTFFENYDHFFSSYFSYDLFSKHPTSEYVTKYISTIAARFTPEQLSPLLIIKATIPQLNPFYVVRRNDEPLNEIIEEKSTVKFLSIEYIHPELVEAIEIKLDESWFIVGNQLFTPSFVLRCLEYQSRGYIFDSGYTIRIMDSNCETIEFGADTYIEITPTGYEWKKCFSLKEMDEEPYDGDYDTDFVDKKNE